MALSDYCSGFVDDASRLSPSDIAGHLDLIQGLEYWAKRYQETGRYKDDPARLLEAVKAAEDDPVGAMKRLVEVVEAVRRELDAPPSFLLS
jgi:hypothetical protein